LENGSNKFVSEWTANTNCVYKLEHIETRVTNPPNSAGWRTLSNSWIGKLYPGGFPRWDLAPEMTILYYAYASGCYLDSVTNGLADPIKFQPIDLQDGEMQVKASVVRSPLAPQLPTRICLFAPNGTRTNGVLSSSNFTNVGNLRLPLNVNVLRYSTAGKLLEEYNFQIEHVRPVCSLNSFIPELTNETLVFDYRFSHGNADVPSIFHGVISNGWPTEQTARMNPSFAVTQLDWEKAMARQRTNPRVVNRPQSPWLDRCFMALSIAGAAVCFAMAFRKRKKSNAIRR
jgi:hypothetical protein